MSQYLLRRVLFTIPVIFAILCVTFILARLVPGDPCQAMLGEKATEDACAEFNRHNGLDRPLPIQLAIYIGQVVRGNLGDSIRFGRPVTQMLVERLPMTLELGLAAMFLATVIGVPAGILSALRRNSGVDVATMVGANVGVSIPVFVLGLLLIFIFAVMLKDTPLALPPSGRLSPGVSSIPFYEVWGWELTEGTFSYYLMEFISNMFVFNSLITAAWEVFFDALRHLILPAAALCTIPLAITARITRSSLLDVLGQDYIRTANAKGLRKQLVLSRHAMRNALLPVVTVIGLQTGAILGGAVLTETIFGLTGVGRSLYEAITSRDFPVIQGFTILITMIYVMINLAVDVSYAFLDPRIRLR